MNTDIYLRNSLNQNFTLNTGSLIQAKFDGEQDFDGILSKIRTGFRFARREAVSHNMQQTNKIAELGCTNQELSKANACLVSSLAQLLAVGTGTGRVAELFAPRAGQIAALARSLAMLRRTEERRVGARG